MKTIMKFNHKLITEDYNLTSQEGEGGRFYSFPDGKKYPSVTTVMGWSKKDTLLEWRKRVGEEQANKISRAAANRGTRLHSICENYLLNDPDYSKSIDIFTYDLFKTIQPILNTRIGEVYAIEKALYSDHLGIAGRVDCVAEFDGKKSIIDFKTSTRLKKKEWIEDYFLQTACYSVMFEERTGISIPRLVIIIAVDNDPPQVFVEKRNDWIQLAKYTIKEYYEHHGLTHGASV
jgi:PD-(D/E)XK nuclease superfamily